MVVYGTLVHCLNLRIKSTVRPTYWYGTFCVQPATVHIQLKINDIAPVARPVLVLIPSGALVAVERGI